MKTQNKLLLSFYSLLLALGLLLALEGALANESFIPLQKGLRIPSDDLLYNNKVLTSREAQNLETAKKVDLSLLNPKQNDIWNNVENEINDQEEIAINEGDELSYEGKIDSASGLYRFNAIPTNGNKIYTIHLDKTLHTLLLRKNILRKLGYKIPAMKYISKLNIQFSSQMVMDNFIKHEVPKATFGATERWATVNNINRDTLSLELRDIAVTEPNEFDFYNVSMGLPTQTINSRTLRSLVVPYALLELGESINKFSWVSCKIDNKAVILSHFTANEFNTSIDDAIWMMKRLNKLKREDFVKAVKNAYFPSGVAEVVAEKLISRRNSLNRCLMDAKIAEIPFNSKITVGQIVVEGKLVQKEFPGYASRFAYGDAQSPLDEIRFFLYSKVQSNVIDNLIAKFNEQLTAYEIGEARAEYFQKLFKRGHDHFVETGELLPIGIGAWWSPVINGDILFSRDIVLGNYLGTDNLVQLADTFGARADLGLFVGIEGIGPDLTSTVKVSSSFVRSYTHLKPVKSLKESLKEPYKNMFVALMKRSLKEKFFSLADIKNSTNAADEKTKQIQELLSDIDKNLAVGESLLITDRIMPTAAVKLNFTQGMIGAGVGVSGGATVVKRIHLYKKSPKVLQIYDDKGFVKNLDLSFQVSNYIPIVKINGRFDKGHYGIKSYMINFSGDLEENPELYTHALGVYNVLKDHNFELLDSVTTPVSLDAQYKDRSTGLSFLFWRMKSVKGRTLFDLKAKDGVYGKYFSLTKDFMTGFNVEAFSKQLVNYYLSTKTDDVSINEEADKNPGQTFFGSSFTQSIRFEASVNEENKFEQKFLSVSDVKQGWALSEKRLKKFMTGVNEKFQFPLFQTDTIDFSKLRLFRIGYHMNVYNPGIARLNGFSMSDINAIENKYRLKKMCWAGDEKYNTIECGDLTTVKNQLWKCKKAKTEEEVADCNVELIESMFNYLDFKDVQKILGADNVYVYGSIDGFREKSEILNDTIYSNSIGKIGSKQWDGPLEVVKDLLGLSSGEFSGGWIREGI